MVTSTMPQHQKRLLLLIKLSLSLTTVVDGDGLGKSPELQKVVDDTIVDPLVSKNLNMTKNDEVTNDTTLKMLLH
jgi:hypothetical protein